MDVAPLRGFVVGVTADRRADEQMELLSRKGASVVHAPMIRTHPLGHEERTAEATASLVARPPDVTVLTTGIGIRAWFEAAASTGLGDALLDALAGSTVVARGHKANGAAVTAGLQVSWQPPGGTAAEVVEELARRGIAGRRVAVQLDGAEGAPLVDELERLGADVVGVPVYRWTGPTDTAPALRLLAAVVEGRVDAVTFTARPQVENLCELAEDAGLLPAVAEAFRTRVRAACVGPVCGAAAVDAGFGEPIVPSRHRLGSMVLALASAFADQAVETSLGGVPVRVQGQVAVVDGAVVELSEREGEVLRALAARPGVVVSKARLLERVWGDPTADEHLVEVTVARLRARLGEAGAGIETVVRRGYRLAG